MATKKNNRDKMRRRRDRKAGNVLPILPGPELTTAPCRIATPEDVAIHRDMVLTMQATANGVGLSAPQVGHNVRIFIMHDPKSVYPLVFVNPEILARSIEMVTDEEGCLSEPGKFVDVERHYAVWIKWYDQFGKTLAGGWSDFCARVIQHEMDHLNGFCKVLAEMNPQKIE